MAKASLAGAVFAMTLLLCGVAFAKGAPDQALELHDEARALYAEGRYPEAVAKLELAVELDPKAKLLYYNLGLIVEKLGQFDAALGYYRKCLELETSAQERVHLARIVKRLEGAKRYVKSASGAAKDRNPSPSPSSSAPPPPPPVAGSGGLSPWMYVTAATAVTAFGIAAVLAARASEIDPGPSPTTGIGTSVEKLEHDADEAHSYAVGADVGFGIGAAATAATIVIAIVSGLMGAGDVDDDSAGERLSFELGPTQGRLVWRF